MFAFAFFFLDIFSKDISGDAERLMKLPLNYDQRCVNSFKFADSDCFPSSAFGRLQVI